MALVWTVMGLFLFIALTGLALDTGYVALVAHQLQNAADAASLGGAQRLLKTDADEVRALARTVGLANKAAGDAVDLNLNEDNADSGDIVLGVFDRGAGTFTAQETGVNAVKVTARRTTGSTGGPVPLVFGPSFGVNTSQVARSAIAMVQGGAGAGVIALNSSLPCSFDIRGTAGTLEVNGGVIYVNSNNPDAACHSGQPTLDAEALYVTGDTDKGFDDKVNFDGNVYPGVPPITDPLAELPEPTYDPALDLGAINVNGGATVNATPGYYSGGISIENGTLNLAPGIYILDGAGLDITGGNLTANGVMFFIVGTGNVDIRGNGIITITPPDTDLYSYPALPDVQPYSDNGVAFFQARDNFNDSRILGTATLNVEGTLYFPEALLEIGGTSNNFANGLIADRIYAHGDGILSINYDDRFPPVTSKVFLVR